MQQFTVPQFIDVEDKIIGPITARQFIIMLGGFILVGLAYRILDFSAFVTFAVIDLTFVIVFSFLKVNGRPFHLFLLNFIQTHKRPYVRVWNNAADKNNQFQNDIEKDIVEEKPTVLARKYSSSRLAELSLIVDTRGAYKGDDQIDDNLFGKTSKNFK